jgi:hypothetical protein
LGEGKGREGKHYCVACAFTYVCLSVCMFLGKCGQLGHGDTSKRTVGRQVKQLTHGVVDVAAGEESLWVLTAWRGRGGTATSAVAGSTAAAAASAAGAGAGARVGTRPGAENEREGLKKRGAEARAAAGRGGAAAGAVGLGQVRGARATSAAGAAAGAAGGGQGGGGIGRDVDVVGGIVSASAREQTRAAGGAGGGSCSGGTMLGSNSPDVQVRWQGWLQAGFKNAE